LDPSTRRNCVAIVVAEPVATLFGHPYFAELLGGITSILRASATLPVIMAVDTPFDMELVESCLSERMVSAAILVSLKAGTDLPARLVERGVPVVVQGRPPSGLDVSSVDVDNRRGGALAVGHLIAEGRRRIATISGDLSMASGVERLMGYRDGLKAAGISPDAALEETGKYQAEVAYLAMERLLLNRPDIDGLFVAADFMADAAVRVLRHADRRIPDDIAVVGYDDSPVARAMHPPLTSIRQPTDAMGREAARLALAAIEDPSGPRSSVVLQPELVARESTIGADPYR
jgi:DNA-binding LacI/PurR family transcriptional regulator